MWCSTSTPGYIFKGKEDTNSKDPCTPLITTALFTIAISSKIWSLILSSFEECWSKSSLTQSWVGYKQWKIPQSDLGNFWGTLNIFYLKMYLRIVLIRYRHTHRHFMEGEMLCSEIPRTGGAAHQAGSHKEVPSLVRRHGENGSKSLCCGFQLKEKVKAG